MRQSERLDLLENIVKSTGLISASLYELEKQKKSLLEGCTHRTRNNKLAFSMIDNRCRYCEKEKEEND